MIFYVCYPSHQITNCKNIMQSLGLQCIEGKGREGDVFGNVMGRFTIAFGKDRVNP